MMNKPTENKPTEADRMLNDLFRTYASVSPIVPRMPPGALLMAGFVTGLRMAQEHPEWMIAYLATAAAPDVSGPEFRNELAAMLAIEHRDGE